MSENDRFIVLHALRLKSVAALEVLEEFAGSGGIGELVDELEEAGEIRFRDGRRVKGWMLTDDGRATHAARIEEERTDVDLADLESVYSAFLGINGEVKRLCSTWQTLPPDDAGRRFDAIDQLEALHERAQVVLEEAATIVPRFATHGRRLGIAIERLQDGEERYFTSPTVDSYHTVWFECHEDFLLSLGRDRAAEGSF